MKIRPLHDRIVVQRREGGEPHIGGIIIPDTAKEKPVQVPAILTNEPGGTTGPGDAGVPPHPLLTPLIRNTATKRSPMKQARVGRPVASVCPSVKPHFLRIKLGWISRDDTQ